MLGPGAAPMDLEFDGPDQRRYTEAPLVMVSNNPYAVRDLSGPATRPRLDGAAEHALLPAGSLGPLREHGDETAVVVDYREPDGLL